MTQPPRRRARPAPRRRGLSPQGRRRLLTLLIVFGLAFGIIVAKLVWIQRAGAASYGRLASGQDQRSLTLPALRGSILAANGDELALSEMRPTVFADPTEITNPALEAARLAPILHQQPATIAADLTEQTTHVVVAAAVSPAQDKAVSDLDLPGIGTQDQPVRYHPDGALAAPLLGTLNSAGNGISGLEYKYNQVLTGTPGKLVETVDPQGQAIAGGVTEDKPARPGNDILTTINDSLQYQTEQALAAQVAKTHATSGTVIVMDRHSGDLLAVADINAGLNGTTIESPTASAFTAVYQPGSVAKLVTVAGALAQRDITPDEELTIPSALPVAGTMIHDAEAHPTEQLSITGILAQSSNIGATEIAQRLGPPGLYQYEQAFGFTQRSAVHFPDESAGIVPTPDQFSGTTLATMAFGEAQAVTAIQVAAAYNTIANSGIYVAPRLVAATVGPHGHEHLLAHPTPRRIVPASVAAAMTPMFEQVISSGTGPNAAVRGYAIAGKTGTSNVLRPGGRYSRSVTNSTFAGYYPAQDPALTEIVVINGTVLYGAEASAPVFSTVAHDAIVDLGIPSDGPQPPADDTAVPTINGQVQTSLLGQ